MLKNNFKKQFKNYRKDIAREDNMATWNHFDTESDKFQSCAKFINNLVN